MLSVGYTLTYFSLDSVFPLVVLSIGCCHGFGFVFCYTARWKVVVDRLK